MQQLIISLPDQLYDRLLVFSESHQTTESQAIVQILTDHLDLLASNKHLSMPINQSDWDNLPDDEPDEILWDFLKSESLGKIQEEDSFDEPDEVLSDFLDD